METQNLPVGNAIQKMKRFVKTAASTDANADVEYYINKEIYMFVIDQMNEALQWLQDTVESVGVGEGCCNDILTIAWLRQMEDPQQVVSGMATGTRRESYTSIRDADSARTCLAQINTDLHDRLKHYEETIKNRDEWAVYLQQLLSQTEKDAEYDKKLELAKFWADRYRDDVDPNWFLMRDAWMPWRDYLVVFL
jgi:hypothetical protein